MAHLTELHSVFRIVDKEIPDGPPMGVVAGDTTHLPAAPLFRRVRLTLERMTITARYPQYMRLVKNMAMT